MPENQNKSENIQMETYLKDEPLIGEVLLRFQLERDNHGALDEGTQNNS